MALETSHTVGAVISVFHNGADLVQQLIKRNKKKKSELAMKQKWLLESLGAAENQIAQKNDQYIKELGAKFRIGDGIATQKLQTISVLMQSDLIRSLQIAIQFDNAVLDLAKLHADATFFTRDVLTALDDLRTRLLQQTPTMPSPLYSQLVPGHDRNSITDPASPASHSSNSSPYTSGVPSGVTIPEDHHNEEPSRRMARFFSMKRQPPERSSSSASSAISQAVVPPTQNWLGPVRTPEPLGFELPAGDVQRPPSQATLNDVKSMFPEPKTNLLHPALQTAQSSINRMASTSTQASRSSDHSNQSHTSVYSDEKIPVVQEDKESVFPNVADLSLTPTRTKASDQESDHQRRISASSTTSHYGSAFRSPDTSVFSASPLPSPANTDSQHFSSMNSWTLFPTTVNGHLSAGSNPHHLSSSTNLSLRDRTSTNSSATRVGFEPLTRPTTAATSAPSIGIPSAGPVPPLPVTPLLGRPAKNNNYWGFCKGSWTIREDWRKGMHKQVLPAGMYVEQHVWRCSQCHFTGDIFGAKKPFTIDPNIHQDKATGIRYRWLFLAKSHTKVKMLAKEGEGGYGCLFCSLNNLPTAVYSSVPLLFKHISEEHAPVMTEDMAMRARCITGRKAEAREDFDVNIL